jgi:ABC-type dipeptide/oligopeptide/nickel transport system ATPase subunit
MITHKNIFKYYDNKFKRTFVLKDVSLTINQGGGTNYQVWRFEL